MHRALVVDATPLIRQIYAVILQDFGFEVSEAGTIKEAINQINRKDPHVVIVDAALPGKSALDILRYVRDHTPKTTHAIYSPIAFDILDLQRAQAAGATDVIVKPFDRGMIAAKIDGWKHAGDVHARHDTLVLAARADLVPRDRIPA